VGFLARHTVATLLARFVAEFDSNPAVSAKALRRLATFAPETFFAAGLALLATVEESRGAGFLAVLVVKAPTLLEQLTNSEAFPLDQAVVLAKRLREVSPNIACGLAKLLPRQDRPPGPETLCGRRALRVLEILDALQDPVAIPTLRRLVRSSDQVLSSKAALALGHGIHNVDWARDVIRETEDGRIRANVLEALWGQQSAEARSLFVECSRSPNNRVAGNAIVGLHLQHDTVSMELVREMAIAPTPERRKTAAWVIGHLADAAFLATLEGLAEDGDPEVRSIALASRSKLHFAAPGSPAEVEVGSSTSPVPEEVVPEPNRLEFHLWVNGSRVGG
jgi:hypothetical protein